MRLQDWKNVICIKNVRAGAYKLNTSKLTILALLIEQFSVIEIFLHEQLYKSDKFQIVHGSIVSFTKNAPSQ